MLVRPQLVNTPEGSAVACTRENHILFTCRKPDPPHAEEDPTGEETNQEGELIQDPSGEERALDGDDAQVSNDNAPLET